MNTASITVVGVYFQVINKLHVDFCPTINSTISCLSRISYVPPTAVVPTIVLLYENMKRYHKFNFEIIFVSINYRFYISKDLNQYSVKCTFDIVIFFVIREIVVIFNFQLFKKKYYNP